MIIIRKTKYIFFNFKKSLNKNLSSFIIRLSTIYKTFLLYLKNNIIKYFVYKLELIKNINF